MADIKRIMQKDFAAANALLGGTVENSDTALGHVWEAGTQSSRIYHRADHFYEVAGGKTPETVMDAIRFRAGIYHDVVYQQIDSTGEFRSGFTPEVASVIGLYISNDSNGLRVAEDLPDPLFQGALRLFNLAPGDVLDPKAGQNEFLSALYAMEQGRDLGIDDKYLLAEMAHIQGTVPFGPANHFATLEDRLANANRLLPEDKRLSETEIHESIISAVSMANVDIGNFKGPFAEFIAKTRELTVEEAKGGASKLGNPAIMWESLIKRAGFFEQVIAKGSVDGSKRVFHAIHGEPPEALHAEEEAQAMENIRRMGDYLHANGAAVALATARHVLGAKNPLQALSTSLNETMEDNSLHITGAGKGQGDADVMAACREEILLSDPLAADLLNHAGSRAIKEITAQAEASGLFRPDHTAESAREAADDFMATAQKILAEKGAELEQNAPEHKKKARLTSAPASSMQI